MYNRAMARQAYDRNSEAIIGGSTVRRQAAGCVPQDAKTSAIVERRVAPPRASCSVDS
jgi:hypothetical protein